MKPKLIACLALVLSGGLVGCTTVGNHSSPPNYEAELRYWRALPYPRVEKLMDKYGGVKADSIWVYEDYYHGTKVEPKDFNDGDFSTVIDFCRDAFDKPTINEIYKREVTPEGKITRKARISVLGQLEFEEAYLDGKRHGTWCHWYPNGKIRFIENYVNGQPDGVALNFSPNGKLLQKVAYRGGKILEAWGVGDGGTWTKFVKNGTGSIFDFGENGKPEGGWTVIDGELGRGIH